MKIRIQKEAVVRVLKAANEVVAKNAVMPIARCVLLDTTDEELRIIGTALDIWGQYVLSSPNVQIDSAGQAILPHGLFMDIMRKSEGENVTIETSKGTFITINAGDARFEIPWLDPDEFPVVTKGYGRTLGSATVISDELKKVIRSVAYAASKDGVRPVLEGVFLTLRDGKLTAVATDSHRLARSSCLVESFNETKAGIIIPAKHTKSILEFEDGLDVSIAIQERGIHFAVPGAEIGIPSIDGKYPDVDRVIPDPNSAKWMFRIRRDELIDALERASVLLDQDPKVQISSSASGLQIAVSGDQKFLETVPTKVQGEMNPIFLNVKFLLEALKRGETPEIEMRGWSEINPCLITEVGGDDLIHLVLPIKVHGEGEKAA